MARFIIRRLAGMVVILFAVSVLVGSSTESGFVPGHAWR